MAFSPLFAYCGLVSSSSLCSLLLPHAVKCRAAPGFGVCGGTERSSEERSPVQISGCKRVSSLRVAAALSRIQIRSGYSRLYGNARHILVLARLRCASLRGRPLLCHEGEKKKKTIVEWKLLCFLGLPSAAGIFYLFYFFFKMAEMYMCPDFQVLRPLHGGCPTNKRLEKCKMFGGETDQNGLMKKFW